MPTINDVIIEIEELRDLSMRSKGCKNLVEQIERVYDVALDHSKYMKGKLYNQDFEQKKKVKIPKSLIKTMHQDSISCMKQNPNDKYHKNACECVHWNSHFGQNSMTLHTHTIPKVDYPSEADIKTTNNLGKENLCIINVSDQTVTCYNKKDNFQKITQQDTY